MHQQKGKKIIFYFLLIFIVGSINNINLSNMKITNVKNINISGLDNLNNKIILKKIQNLNLENIFFLNRSKIRQIIESNSLVEEYKILKKYPSTINIEIQKTIFLAKINQNDKIFIIGSNGKLSKNETSIKNLPYIFGNPEISEFLNFKRIIDESKISYNGIKNLYFFKSKRWDIELKNNILIKLSKNNLKASLDNVFEFMNEPKFSNVKVIDARIKNQIIVND
tara:strand:+ start:137 stop:808 length:672 start_codon:yes stop_codon:yes gene_type:complete